MNQEQSRKLETWWEAAGLRLSWRCRSKLRIKVFLGWLKDPLPFMGEEFEEIVLDEIMDRLRKNLEEIRAATPTADAVLCKLLGKRRQATSLSEIPLTLDADALNDQEIH